MMNVVQGAYSFVSGNYKPGDQVILTVYSPAIDPDRYLKAAETLAKHLHDGTRPGDRPESHPSSGHHESPGKIPIHGVVVWVFGETREMCEVNDELKSRFPPGIQHIISFTYDGGDRSCATKLDMSGVIVWREICISPGGVWDFWIHCTKHVIYWKEGNIPTWDKDDPVWTQELNSSPGGAQDGLGLGLTKPVGMYRHELRKYRLYKGRDGFILVWKSYRGEKVNAIDWARKQVVESDQLLTEDRRKLAKDRANVGVDMDENHTPLNWALILINQQIAAYFAAQILVHNQPYRMAEKYTEVALADVMWGNLGINP
ncbi:hypothetical protein RSOLAG22IIIB_07620 [Rhizoctonia solani]|uniref:Uncharacterized protein n=1 Tax=Rhizoctonia solani TaxID=456999 RepID=A0A0K6FNU0_9AGAM|nr:hypothetical protein RSOLAG22IIIB_07620 [Rhizoctonia solani]